MRAEVSWGMQGPRLHSPLHPKLSTGFCHTCPLTPLSFPYTRDARLLPTVILLITAPQLGPAAGGT